jgi:hypothetical protein
VISGWCFSFAFDGLSAERKEGELLPLIKMIGADKKKRPLICDQRNQRDLRLMLFFGR